MSIQGLPTARKRRTPCVEILILGLTLLLGCDQAATPPNAQLNGASHLAFRCLDLTKTPAQSAPLDQCGCLETTIDSSGRTLSQLDPSSCQVNDGFEVVGYVGSATQEKIGVLRLDQNTRGVLDLDPTIPGVSHFYASDFITDLGVHPYGDFFFIIHGINGTISLTADHRELRPDLKGTFDLGQLSFSTIWPRTNDPLPSSGSPSYLYVVASDTREILEIDLDLVSLELQRTLAGERVNPDEHIELQDTITRRWSLDAYWGDEVVAGRLSINRSGDLLAVGFANRSAVGFIDLHADQAEAPASSSLIELKKRSGCDDAYLTQVLGPVDAVETCQDGIDNNGDGVFDQRDPLCVKYGIEATQLDCVQRDECADGVDNDGDGQVDQDDAGCQEAQVGLRLHREGRAPECDDGIDNDSDGLIDRADTGCAHQEDDQEAYEAEISSCFDDLDNDGDGDVDLADQDCEMGGDPLRQGPKSSEGDDLCSDGIDNDSDGLIDYQDPGCYDPNAARLHFEAIPQCSDGIDNDGDGEIDYGGDLNCSSATDQAELGRNQNGLPLSGSRVIELVSIPTTEGDQELLITHSEDGALLVSSLKRTNEGVHEQTQLRVAEVSYPSAVEVRSLGALQTLWVSDQRNSLSAIQLTAPVPLKTVSGEVVYARGGFEAVEGGGSAIEKLKVDSFYVVREGWAYALPLNDYVGSVEIDPRTRVPLLPQSASDALLSMSLEELDELTPLELPIGLGGLGDLQVFLDVGYQLNTQRWNRNRTALGQMSRVSEAPVFFMNGVRINQDKAKHVGFCSMGLTSLAQQQGSDRVDDEGGCVLVGSEISGRAESDDEAAKRKPNELEDYEGIVVTENRSERVISGPVSVAFEGQLPNSRSRSGLHLGADEDTWSLGDSSVDFCALGVEEGDLILVDRFFALDGEAASSSECAEFLSIAAGSGVDPLRYRVLEVGQHKLTLGVDPRADFDPQLKLLGTSRLPKLAPAPSIPPFKCAAQNISYFVRAGLEQWLVSSLALGYRHPWISRSGRCVIDPVREAQRWKGRARLGEVYEDEWMRFQLGFQRSEPGLSGIPQGSLPIMVGSRFEFELTRGAEHQLISTIGALPEVIRWIPERDRMYVIDAALRQITEYTGLDPYQDLLRVVQIFQ